MEANAQRARRAGAHAYGAKVLTDQLKTVQGVHDPVAFFQPLLTRGWAVVGLTRRNLLRQAISWLWAAKQGNYHVRRGETTAPARVDRLTVDVDELIAMMAMIDDANGVVDDLVRAASRSCRLYYEDDLSCPAPQQRTVQSVTGWLGVRSVPVHTDLVPTTAGPLRDRIRNFDEVVAAVERTAFASWLEEDP
jgi:hypothetical protein